MHELILGGAKSGKSRLALARAADWLAGKPGRSAILVATAWAGDEEMAARIARHRAERAASMPALQTVEWAAGSGVDEPLGLTLQRLSQPACLLVVDCLTLWLTQCLLPPPGLAPRAWMTERQALLAALPACAGPLVLVSNEIGLGLMPLAREARQCLDALGELHQAVAALCGRVTLMVAGCALPVKGPGVQGAR